jgi:hypothetical protein
MTTPDAIVVEESGLFEFRQVVTSASIGSRDTATSMPYSES